MAGEDESVTLSLELREDISSALRRIEQQLGSLDRKIDESGDRMRESGRKMGEGADDADAALGRLGRRAKRTGDDVDDLGNKTERTGKKAKDSGDRFEHFSKKTDKASKSLGGFGPMLKLFTWGGMLAGGVAVGGILLGVAHALAGPMVAGLAAVLPLMVAAKLAMFGWKIAADALKPELEGLKKTFSGVGPAFANSGLKQELGNARTALQPLAKMAETGFAGLGNELSKVVHDAVDLGNSGQMLKVWSDIFAGMRPILLNLGEALLSIIAGISYLFRACLPLGADASEMLRSGADAFADWAARVGESGQATAWLRKKWDELRYTIGIIVDVVKGVIGIMRGARDAMAGLNGPTGTLMQNLHDAAAAFNAWANSVEGQTQIRDFFTKVVPPVLALGRVLWELFKAVVSSGLLEAFGQLGMALAQILQGIDPQGLVIIVQALAMMAQALAWVITNVPGMSTLISVLLTLAVVGGATFKVLGMGAKTFGWISGAIKGTGELTLAQKALGKAWQGVKAGFDGVKAVIGVMGGWSGIATKVGNAFKIAGGWILSAFKAIGTGIMWVGRALMTAMMANPVIAAIIIIIGILILLWFKCQWFRDAVIAVWEWIKMAAGVAWQGILAGVRWVVGAAVAVWEWLKNAWRATVDFIVMVAMWIWDHGLGQVCRFILGYWKIVFTVIVFIVKVAVYIIVAIITLIAIVAKAVWDGIVIAAQFLWRGIVAIWNGIVAAAQWAFNLILAVVMYVAMWIYVRFLILKMYLMMIWYYICAAAQVAFAWLMANVIMPVVNFIRMVWGGIVAFFSFIWSMIVAGATIAWNWIMTNVITPVVDFLKMIWTGVVAFFTWIWQGIVAGATWLGGVLRGIWDGIVSFLTPIFTSIGNAGRSVWDSIRGAAEFVGRIVRGVWDGIVAAVKGVYNFLANAWNGIPSITVPAFVPLIGGQTFSLPKLPTLEQGGRINWGSALVGEAGPEALVKSGKLLGMVGMNGPEIRHDLPTGGYVVPGLDTLSRMPGLARSIPGSVASAVSGAVPGYSDLLDRTPQVSATVERDRSQARRDARLLGAIERLTEEVAKSNRPEGGGPRKVNPRDELAGLVARHSY